MSAMPSPREIRQDKERECRERAARLRQSASEYRDIAQSFWIMSHREQAVRADRRAELLEQEAARLEAGPS